MSLPGHPPRISIITPSLNSGRFLRETIESILAQSTREFEHIIVDGGSVDGTLSILDEYPHIRWVSQKDECILQAFRTALSMSSGDYVIQCCISDGFLDKQWFQRCINTLDADKDVSLVWGLPQYMSESGDLQGISYSYFLDERPPEELGFLSFWLATGFVFPEGNYCVRRDILDKCLPEDKEEDIFRLHCALGFIYNFNTQGYLSRFLPVVANYGRLHVGSRGQTLKGMERPLERRYFDRVRAYRADILRGRIRHSFRDGSSVVLNMMTKTDVKRLRREVRRYRLWFSPIIRTDVATAVRKVRQKGISRSLAWIKENLFK